MRFRCPWYKLDSFGEPVPCESIEDFVRWQRSQEECGIDWRRVAVTYLPGGWWISTVFLGMDHSMGFLCGADGEKPVVFETMVFKGGWEEQWTSRYNGRAEAEAGHELALATLLREKRWMRWRFAFASFCKRHGMIDPLSRPFVDEPWRNERDSAELFAMAAKLAKRRAACSLSTD